MTHLQEPNVPTPSMAIEIDKIIEEVKGELSLRNSWLTHPFGRSYRNLKLDGGNYFYYPEVYIGVSKNVPQYFIVKPDNDKKGQCFFIVGKERQLSFQRNVFNMLEYDLSIVFMVNLELIDNNALQSELITQMLIRDVRQTLTRRMSGYAFQLEIIEIVREFQDVFREYNFKEAENYLRAPLQAFRFNCKIVFQEGCYQDNQLIVPPPPPPIDLGGINVSKGN